MAKPSKQEQGRIKMLDKIRKDKNQVEVGQVADIFTGVLAMITEKTNTFKKVKAKLSEDEFVSMINCISISFLSSLYTSGSKDDEELEKRMNYVNKVNQDILVGVGVIKDKKNG